MNWSVVGTLLCRADDGLHMGDTQLCPLSESAPASLKMDWNGFWYTQPAFWIWIGSFKRCIELGTCRARGAEQPLYVFIVSHRITEWLRLERTLKPTQFHLLPWARLPLTRSGCPGFADVGDRHAASKHQSAQKQNDFNVNLQHHLKSWKGDNKSLACWLFVFVARIHLFPAQGQSLISCFTWTVNF